MLHEVPSSIIQRVDVNTPFAVYRAIPQTTQEAIDTDIRELQIVVCEYFWNAFQLHLNYTYLTRIKYNST